jgi:hypothetical protein
VSSDLDLLGQNIVPNLVLVRTPVRSPSEHHFIDDHSHSEVVRHWSVRQTAHSLRGHVAWRATCLYNSSNSTRGRRLVEILTRHFAGNSKVCEHEVAVLFKYQVLRFDVSVDNALSMNIF